MNCIDCMDMWFIDSMYNVHVKLMCVIDVHVCECIHIHMYMYMYIKLCFHIVGR